MKYFRLNYGQGCLGQVTAQEGGASSGLALGLPFQQQGSRGAAADGRASRGPAQAPPPQGRGPGAPRQDRASVWGLTQAAQSPGQAAA